MQPHLAYIKFPDRTSLILTEADRRASTVFKYSDVVNGHRGCCGSLVFTRN